MPEPVVTVTVTERFALPPAPLQVSVNILVLASGPRVSLPEVALLPDQALEAVHESVFVDVQLTVDDSFALMLVGLALSESVGARLVTVTLAEAFAVPPAPVQVNEYVLLVVSAPVD